ncbi:hypothetical protein QQP08_011422, partial [Theobroma cacao]
TDSSLIAVTSTTPTSFRCDSEASVEDSATKQAYLLNMGESKEISTKKRYVKEEERVKKRSNLEELEEEIVKEGHGLVKRFCLDLGNLPYFVLILLQSPHFPPILTRQIQSFTAALADDEAKEEEEVVQHCTTRPLKNRMGRGNECQRGKEEKTGEKRF